MYAAEGVELTESQYDVLVHVERTGGQGKPHDQGSREKATYREVELARLIAYHSDAANRVTEAWVTRFGRNWLACFRRDEAEKRRMSHRDWWMIVVNVGGGAIAGGAVSVLTSVIVNLFLH